MSDRPLRYENIRKYTKIKESKFDIIESNEKNHKIFPKPSKNNNMATSPRSRRQLKVGPSNAPEPNCPEGYYRWKNYFASGCKPANEDRRSLGIGGKTLWARIKGGAAPIQADGYDNYDGLYGVSSGRKSARRNYGSSSGRRNYGSARRYY
jgi:hypothetical protein